MTKAKTQAAQFNAADLAAAITAATPAAPVVESKPVTKGRTKAKPAAEKTTAPAATLTAATAKAMPIKFKVSAHLRAAADNRLFSHTEAVFQLLDMYGKGAMSRTSLNDIFGGKTTANYHISKGRFLEGKNGLTLSKDGKEWFKARGNVGNGIRFNPQDVEAFKEILTKGTDTSGRIVTKGKEHMVTAFTPS